MVEIFKYVVKFFTSLTNYVTYNDILIIFVGLFLFTVFCVVISTSRAYEARLIKAIDKFNNYFIDNPQINEDNLVAFNAKMKSKSVPKQLRKSWQQYVLYRENKASSYMSFENCVSNPIKNSSYKRDIKLMNTLAYVFSICALILNCYYCFETNDLANVLQSVLVTPVIILLLNYIVQIFLNLRHNAIVSDLFQNYQYFEVNIDKATETLPDYVDYEVLFDRNEIKKGIPILYAYLQKRAEEEQRELERVRLKNVEHEKFNFDDQGVAASLVLERAMQEAENYIAERKKYNQDTQQINSDITQEDMNYREITKEYNRQMQVSKETFANFKAQLEEASSTIEANYLKKQQQQELDRQRNLERDFDTATERHKKVIESYQAELDAVDKFIAQSRKNLETAMKNEFSTYSSKVYDEAKKLVETRESDNFGKLKLTIKNLEEQLAEKSNIIDNLNSQNEIMHNKLEEIGVVVTDYSPAQNTPVEEIPIEEFNYGETEQPAETQEYYEGAGQTDNEEYYNDAEGFVDNQKYDDQSEQVEYNYDYDNAEEVGNEEYYNETDAVDYDEEYSDEIVNNSQDYNEDEDIGEDEGDDEFTDFDDIYSEEENLDEEFINKEDEEDEEKAPFINEISTALKDDSIQEEKVVLKRGRPRKVVDAETKQGEKKKRGRPRKAVVPQKEEVETRRVGRPKKEVEQPVVEQKKGRGRPKKLESIATVANVKKGRGRPKKVEVATPVVETKKGRGRPKKEVQQVVVTEKRGRGRPKKVEATAPVTEVKKGRGRPKKEISKPVVAIKKGRGRPKKVENKVPVAIKKGRGRPKKAESTEYLNAIKNIDEYLKQIDNEIAQENSKLEETKKELEKKTKLKRKK